MTHRRATLDDLPVLSELNHQLIRDEGHRNRMTTLELSDRMHAWLDSGEYTAVLFESNGGAEILAYALYREQPAEVYLRQFFVVPGRRQQGLGREVMQILLTKIWPAGKRLTVEVLCANAPAIAFYRSLGYADYCLSLEIMPRILTSE